jgi:hypothetical protein
MDCFFFAYNINKRQSDFSGQKFQWKKFWKKKIQALGSLLLKKWVGSLKLIQAVHRVKWTWAMWKWPFGNAA